MDRDAWNARYSGTEMVWSITPNQFVAAETADLPRGRALDVACGEGRNAIWLAEQGWAVTAVDFADAAIDTGRRLAAERGVEVTWVVDDVTTQVPEPGAYALVLLAYLQLPEPRRRAVTATASAAVAPGGTFLLVAHDRSNLDGGHGGPQDPAVLPTPDEVVADLDGFEIVRAEVVERQVGEHTALDTLVRARRPV